MVSAKYKMGNIIIYQAMGINRTFLILKQFNH